MSPGYHAPWWMPGAHLQTILPARWLAAPRVALLRERWDTPDGDFLDVDHAQPSPASADAPVLLVLHGLEGGADSHYARALLAAARARGWRGLVVHFRGCGGEENRLPRAYHAGDVTEIDFIVRTARARWPAAPRFAAGISLGGNALARWAGEGGGEAGGLLAAAAVSAPLDLLASAGALERGAARLYAANFLSTLRAKGLAKVARFPGLADSVRISRARTLREFDDAFTAPVHGFHGVLDYWTRASARPVLGAVRMPLLLLNARNDPFLPACALPHASDCGPGVVLEQPREGGHAGFHEGRAAGGPWYIARRLPRFFADAAGMTRDSRVS